MTASTPQAMVSSPASLSAERAIIKEELERAFERVVLAPEDSIAGTQADGYLEKVKNTDFLIVLLTQESRPAVLRELEVAVKSNVHIAAFTLRYQPHIKPSGGWVETAEETYVKAQNLWIREASSITGLRRDVMHALTHFLATATRKHHFEDSSHLYSFANDWLKDGRPRRVALVQQTSMLVLGPRDMQPAEAECMQQVLAYVKKVRASPHDYSFVHVFDKAQTEAEARQESKQYSAAPALSDSLLAGYAQHKPPFHIAAVANTQAIGSVLLVDNHVGFLTSLGAGGKFVNFVNDKAVADSVYRALSRNARGGFNGTYLQTVRRELNGRRRATTRSALGGGARPRSGKTSAT